MNYLYHPKENERVAEARDSFSGRPLTNSQFDEGILIGVIVEREILRNGAFKEKLTDYSHAFARTEQFDTARAETIIRDLFKARTRQVDEPDARRADGTRRKAHTCPAQARA